MKKIYTCSANDDSIIMLYEGEPLFKAVMYMLEDIYGIEKDSFGSKDLLLQGKDIPLMKESLEQAIQEKLAVFAPIGEPNVKMNWLGEIFALNTRDSEQQAIYYLSVLLDMVNIETTAGGPIWFYNIAFADHIDHYLLSLIKAVADGIPMDATFAKLREKHEGVTAGEFDERITGLKEQGFIQDTGPAGKDTLLYPSEKTLKVQMF